MNYSLRLVSTKAEAVWDGHGTFIPVLPCPNPDCCSPTRLGYHERFEYIMCQACGVHGPYSDGHMVDSVRGWNDLPRVGETGGYASDKIALFDLDGTLADFEKEFMERMEALRSPTETKYGPDDFWADNLPDYVKARKRLVKAEPGFWTSLPPIPLGFEIFNVAVNEIGSDPVVLTKGPYQNPRAWMEKVEWCNKHLTDVPVTIAGGDDRAKGKVYGRVLVDDYPPYVEAWLRNRRRGLVIMPYRKGTNDGFKHGQVVLCDGRNMDEVRERLQKAFDRQSGSDT